MLRVVESEGFRMISEAGVENVLSINLQVAFESPLANSEGKLERSKAQELENRTT